MKRISHAFSQGIRALGKNLATTAASLALIVGGILAVQAFSEPTQPPENINHVNDYHGVKVFQCALTETYYQGDTINSITAANNACATNFNGAWTIADYYKFTTFAVSQIEDGWGFWSTESINGGYCQNRTSDYCRYYASAPTWNVLGRISSGYSSVSQNSWNLVNTNISYSYSSLWNDGWYSRSDCTADTYLDTYITWGSEVCHYNNGGLAATSTCQNTGTTKYTKERCSLARPIACCNF